MSVPSFVFIIISRSLAHWGIWSLLANPLFQMVRQGLWVTNQDIWGPVGRIMLFKQEERGTKRPGQDGVEGKGTVHFFNLLKGLPCWWGVDLFFVILEKWTGATGYKVCFSRRQEFLMELSKPTSPQVTSLCLPLTTIISYVISHIMEAPPVP